MKIQITLFILGSKEPITITIDTKQTLQELIEKIEELRGKELRDARTIELDERAGKEGKKEPLVQYFLENGKQLSQDDLSSSLEKLGFTSTDYRFYASTNVAFETRHNLSKEGVKNYLDRGAKIDASETDLATVPEVLRLLIADYLSVDPSWNAIYYGLANISNYYENRLNRLEQFMINLPEDWEVWSEADQNKHKEEGLPNATHLHELIPYFTQAKKEPNATLMEAAKTGNIWLMKLALKYGADINIQLEGSTPLIASLSSSHFDFAAELLNSPGIDFNGVDHRGYTPLMVCIVSWVGAFDSMILNLILSNPKVSMNQENNFGLTALHLACNRANKTVAVRLLLNRKDTNVNVQDRNGNTPLMYACGNGSNASIKELLTRKNLKVNLRGRYGYTALHIASTTPDSATTVQLLLDFQGIDKIDTSIKDSSGGTALDNARKLTFLNENAEIVRIIEGHNRTNKRSTVQKITGFINELIFWQNHLKQSHPKEDLNQLRSYLNEILKKAKFQEVEYRELGKTINRVYLFKEGASDEDKIKLRGQLNEFFKQIHEEEAVADINSQGRLFIDHISFSELTKLTAEPAPQPLGLES